jgi:hypothetical protein
MLVASDPLSSGTSVNAKQTCRYNCFAFCAHGKPQLRALRVIEPSEELTIAHVGLDPPFLERRQALQDSYLFDLAPSVCTLHIS